MAKKSAIEAGGVYGQLEVIGLKHEDRGGRRRLVAYCQCRLCGGTKPILAQNLLSGNTKTCGCGGTDFERLLSRQNAQMIGDMMDGKLAMGELVVAEAWYTGKDAHPTGRGRDRVWVRLICPWCSRHLIWRLEDAERRNARSCGCTSWPKYVTEEEKAEKRKRAKARQSDRLAL